MKIYVKKMYLFGHPLATDEQVLVALRPGQVGFQWLLRKKIFWVVVMVLFLLVGGGLFWTLECSGVTSSCVWSQAVPSNRRKQALHSNVFLDTHQKFFGDSTACYPTDSVTSLWTAYPLSMVNYTYVCPPTFVEVKGEFGLGYPGPCLYYRKPRGTGYPGCMPKMYCGDLYLSKRNITLTGWHYQDLTVTQEAGTYPACCPEINSTDTYLYLNCFGEIVYKNVLRLGRKDDPSMKGMNTRYAPLDYQGPLYAHPGFYFLSNGTYSNMYRGRGFGNVVTSCGTL